MNNKGFMMAEVVVVASLVLIALVGFYTSYNKILSIYNQRVDYYDVDTLYRLSYIRDSLSGTKLQYNATYGKMPGEIAYFVNINQLDSLQENDINQTFKDYLNFLSTSINEESIGTEDIFVMEKCPTKTKDDNTIEVIKKNCKYAYLEVFDNETSE